MKNVRLSKIAWALVGAAVLSGGCATNIRKPTSAPLPASVRFSEFKAFVLKPVALAPAFAQASANKKAAKKIDEEMFAKMKLVFPGLTRPAADASASKGDDVRTLSIEPRILEIKFIGGAARFWAGAMAGSSAVLMQVNFVDQKTGDVVANPEFYRAASAFTGGWSYGATDNLMLDEIAQDAVNYASYNR